MTPSKSSKVTEAKRLRRVAELIFSPQPPYDYRGSFLKLSHFRTGDMHQKETTIWRTIRHAGRCLGLKIQGNSDRWAPEVRVHVFSRELLPPTALADLNETIRWRFDMQSDLGEFVPLAEESPVAKPVLTRWLGSRPTCAYSLYEFVAICLCLQNTNVQRTIRMMDSLFKHSGELVEFDRKFLWGFWEPNALVNRELELRKLKLGYRAKFLERMSTYFAELNKEYENELRRCSDEDLFEALKEIPGVGPATATYLSFEYFHRYDALRYLPPWETKIYRNILELPDASSDTIIAFARKTWPGFSMLALHILFEDQFWKLREGQAPWLEAMVR